MATTNSRLKARIVPTYTTCCFCHKPELTALNGVAYAPRFQFMKAVKQCADQNGVTEIVRNRVAHSALGVLDTPCAHFNQQVIRFDWHIDYTN